MNLDAAIREIRKRFAAEHEAGDPESYVVWLERELARREQDLDNALAFSEHLAKGGHA